jgi:hypothetical protein
VRSTSRGMQRSSAIGAYRSGRVLRLGGAKPAIAQGGTAVPTGSKGLHGAREVSRGLRAERAARSDNYTIPLDHDTLTIGGGDEARDNITLPLRSVRGTTRGSKPCQPLAPLTANRVYHLASFAHIKAMPEAIRSFKVNQATAFIFRLWRGIGRVFGIRQNRRRRRICHQEI